jgi:hypothetical protein
MVLDFTEEEEKSEIIEEMEGVPYINEEVLNTDDKTKAPLNPELKVLVDSVIK